LHVRSLAPPPAIATYWPRVQSDHLVHDEAPYVVLNVPASQVPHTRLTVGVPAVASYIPGPHAVNGTHSLAGFAS
jgi:hypothetical protein